jgi:tetratricopeptide (TPR) repeat protein
MLGGLLMLWPVAAAAQGGSISGSVFLPGGAPLNERARVILQTDRGIKSNVYTDNRGRFQFDRLTPTVYEVLIEADGDRFEVGRASVEVFPGSPAIVNITLKEVALKDAKAGGKAISTGELDTTVPRAARKEFERGSEAVKTGRIEDAIIHFRNAIAIYPQYVMARNDLGTELLAQGKLDEAADELRRAIELDPKAFNPRLNMGIVLVQQHKFMEATDMLKAALALQSNDPAARLYYGMALAGLNALTDAERELKTAHELGGPPFAVALFHLGEVYVSKGEPDLARRALESYLREAPDDSNAPQARRLLQVLH